MSEKRVSVRLAAVGGRQVKAELQGVGDTGGKAFARLSREMEAANARMASFARAARAGLTAAAAGATASLGLIVRSAAESGAQLRQFVQVANATPEGFQRWSGAARTVGIEQEKLADILKDVNDRVGDFLQTGGGPMADFFEKVAPRVGVTADQFARLSGPEALQLYVDTLQRAGLSQQEMTFHLEAMASDATRLLPLLRGGGAEMQRLGDRAADLGAVLDADALKALQRTEVALDTMSLVMEELRNRIAVAAAPAVEALASAFVTLASAGGIVRTAIDMVIGNLGRVATYAATAAAFFVGRWVAGMVAAAVSVRGLGTALVVLRGALIRTGIGALIVGAGELIYQFGRLVSSTGGFGKALSLLADVATEVWERIKSGDRLRQAGDGARQEHRRHAGQRVPQRRGGVRRVRADGQDRLPQPGQLDARRYGQGGGAAVHLRAALKRAVGRYRSPRFGVRQRLPRRRCRGAAGADASRAGRGVRWSASVSCGRRGGTAARRGAGDPAAQKTRSVPS
ncbi:hypothetical protein MRB58_11255 [Acuticoccus sp. I52.16.1]|nr:hypothetical protein [Acuticoccus sp. I52.16.1]UOM36723.1 hypothetical protein MRB58_11255 [Acuticoccus sp. I52.16.1]